MLAKIAYFKPVLVIAACPCGLWGHLAKFKAGIRNYSYLSEQRQYDEKDFLDFVKQIVILQEKE